MSFASRVVEVWDLDGNVVAELTRMPLAERIPIQGVLTGPRSHGWRATAGTAEVVWIEALDGGDPKAEAEHRDRVMMIGAPFTGEAREVVRLEDRSVGMMWVAGGNDVMCSEYDRDERWERTWLGPSASAIPTSDSRGSAARRWRLRACACTRIW